MGVGELVSLTTLTLLCLPTSGTKCTEEGTTIGLSDERKFDACLEGVKGGVGNRKKRRLQNHPVLLFSFLPAMKSTHNQKKT